MTEAAIDHAGAEFSARLRLEAKDPADVNLARAYLASREELAVWRSNAAVATAALTAAAPTPAPPLEAIATLRTYIGGKGLPEYEPAWAALSELDAFVKVARETETMTDPKPKDRTQ